MSDFYVYCYSTPGKFQPFYIGKGKEDRAWEHLTECLRRKGNCYNTLFYRKLRKLFREGTFPTVHIIAANLPEYLACALEVVLIRMLGRRDVGTGQLCNLTDGGEGVTGRVVSLTARLKMSQARKARLPYKLSPEHCQHIAESNRGRKRSLEFCKKLGERLRGRVVSDDTRRKISATRHKYPVVAVSTDGATVVYDSIRAADACGHNRTSIWRCLNGQQETYHNMVWRRYA